MHVDPRGADLLGCGPMEDQPTRPVAGLPENAFRELKEGETYVPTIPDETGVPDQIRSMNTIRPSAPSRSRSSGMA